MLLIPSVSRMTIFDLPFPSLIRWTAVASAVPIAVPSWIMPVFAPRTNSVRTP